MGSQQDGPNDRAAVEPHRKVALADSALALPRLVGSDHHAWVFSSGGTWQGVSAGWYHVLAPHVRRLVDLSGIPVIREDDQAHRYRIELFRRRGASMRGR